MDPMSDTDLDRLRHEAYADSAKLDDRRALYEYQDPRPDFYGWILDQVDWPAPGRVLDLGCGPGTHLARLAERSPQLGLVAADVSTGMLAVARQAVPAAAPVAVDAMVLPFAADSFDAVMANHMLYHVADLDQTVAELRRVIVAGGVLSAVTNSLEHLGELMGLLAEVAGKDVWVQPSDRFNLEHSGADLERGFEQVDVRHHVGTLIVPDVEPLVTYVRSVRALSGREYTDNDWNRLVADFERAAIARIERDGSFRITTHAGAFVCR
jgi:SAM-dependent methyltransferase